MKRIAPRTVGLSSPRAAAGSRRAATLTEVLISMLIMGIGVVTLATLFPISILRSVQATQLTNATILRYGAEAFIDTYPQIVFEPDGAGTDDLTLSPNLPPPPPAPPPYHPDAPITEHFQSPTNRRYVVDPQGWNLMPATFRNTFGNNGAGPVGNIRRFGGGYIDANANGRWDEGEDLNANGILDSGEDANGNGILETEIRFDNDHNAAQLVTLPDSWVFVTDGVPTVSSPTTVTFGSTVDLAGVVPDDGIQYRITIFDVTGKFSQVRRIPVGGVTGGPLPTPYVVTWTHPLPAGFTPGVCRVDVQERRYTYLLTVRRQASGGAHVDVVVFFNRGFESTDDERVYSAVFDVNGPPSDPGKKNKIDVDWSGAPKPFYRRGGFVFDAQRARWYRIQGIEAETSTSVRLVLDRDVIENSNSALFMRGIIEVFSLPPRPMP